MSWNCSHDVIVVWRRRNVYDDDDYYYYFVHFDFASCILRMVYVDVMDVQCNIAVDAVDVDHY